MFKNRLVTTLIVIVVLLLALGKFLGLYTDWLWFNSISFGSVFTQTFLLKAIAFFAVGLIVFIIVYFNLQFTRRLLAKSPSYRNFSDDNIEFLTQRVSVSDYIIEFVKSRFASKIILLVSLVFGLLSGYTGSYYWMEFAQFTNWTPFGITDPLFEADIGYYIFKLPFYLILYNTVLSTLLFTTLAIAVIYYLVGLFQKFQAHPGAERTFNSAISHLSLSGAVTLLIKAFGYKLDADQLMYSPRGVAFGASYTDLYAERPIFYIMLFLSVIGALIYFANIRMKKLKPIIAVPIVLVAFNLIVGNVYPAIIQQFVVTPNELEKEAPFIQHNITYTRKAYGLANIEEKYFPANLNLTADDLDNNSTTIENIRLHDLNPLLDTYNQIEAIRPYYDFLDVDIDRYIIDGKLRQVMLSSRELNIDKLDSTAQSWINLHLKYTHGQGAVVSPVNKVSTQGLPTFFVHQIPPISNQDEVAITQPDIYFGELTNHYIITNTNTPEIDYTSSEGPITDFYQGTEGIPLTFSNKLLYSFRLGTLKLFLNTDINSESQLILNRNIVDRVKAIAPFLLYDNDPYLVVDNGKLYWIIDAYTYTGYYPYSEPYQQGLNYINNSIKVIIDAYTGTTKYYLYNQEDPLALTYQKIFPNLFADMNEMPQSLRMHVRYPESLFNIQAQMLLHYHMTEVSNFFYKDDAWEIADEVYGQSGQIQVSPNYLLMRLPGEEEEEFILMLPFTPAERNNLVAWLAARMDGEHYGQLLLFQFPRQEFVNGTLNIENRIDQDTIISEQLTLWSQQGSGVIRGNLMVIPLEESLLYVEPIYLKANEQGLPELKRIVVAYGDRIVMESTLEDALQLLFGDTTEPETPETPTNELNIAELTAKAQEIYNQMQEALRAGQWAEYGQYQEELKQVLDLLAAETAQPESLLQ